MNDRVRNIDLAALAAATGPDGRVDFTRFEAQRLILSRQQIDGIDAGAIVRDITASPAFAQGGPESARPLLDAIRANVSPTERLRFNEAIDRANHWDGAIERASEVVGGAISGAYTGARDGISALDARATQALGEWRQWADGERNSTENSYLQRAAGTMAAGGIGTVQENYGRLRGATSGAVSMLGDTVDLAQFGARFATDQDFRNLMIGAAAVYANDVREGRRSPVDDVSRAARGAWNEWQEGLEQAQRNGTADQYLGTAQGRVGVELLAAVVPVTKLARFGRLATTMDVEAAQGVGTLAGREAAREAREIVSDLAEGARAAQRSADPEIVNTGNLLFNGLAGVRRSQGELRGLVDEMRASGNLDGLLSSGALRPMELGYLARTDPAAFRGDVSFDRAITAYVGNRPLTALTARETGEIGEAIASNHLVQQGYRDIVPIQNNSGHGIDLVATDQAGRQAVFEIKASVQGIAREQRGDPDTFIASRLARAEAERGVWAPQNVWEEQVAAAARRILTERVDPITGALDVDPKWGRVNIERDASGVVRGTPDIQPWRSPQQQIPTPGQRTEGLPDAAPPGIQRKMGGTASLLDQLTPEDARLAGKIQQAVPNLSEEHLALATLLAKKDGITDESKLRTAAISGDTLWIVGNTPGFRERINLSEKGPAVQDTINQMQAFNTQQREVQLAQAQEVEQRQQAQGMVMRT